MTIGMLLTIKGTYLRIFYEAGKISEETIQRGNAYLYLSIPLLFAIAALLLFRNFLQGLGKPLSPFLGGIGELVARLLACLAIPLLLSQGHLHSESPKYLFYLVCAGDAIAWIIATLIMLPTTIKVLMNYRKETLLKQSGELS